MTDQKPIGPFTLTPPRILLLVLGALALTFIIGGIMGGVAVVMAGPRRPFGCTPLAPA